MPLRTEPSAWGNGQRPLRITAATVTAIVRSMRKEPARELKTCVLSDELGIAADAFIRAFKQATGLSPQRFHAALRIEKAKQLLVDTEQSVTDICFEVGYQSLGTFVRTFTMLVGLAPTQLRKLARGDDPAAISAALANAFQTRQRVAAGRVLAEIDPAPPAGLLVAAGVFPQSIPAGLPFDGRFVSASERAFSLARPATRGSVCLLAAAVAPITIEDAWAGRLAGLLVARATVPTGLARSAEPMKLRLHRLTDTDPPFLTPVPLLLLLQASQSERSGSASIRHDGLDQACPPQQRQSHDEKLVKATAVG